MQLFGYNITDTEVLVIGVIILGSALFEAGPKLLNFIKNRRQKKS
jgi:hypothetical protein